MGRTTLIIDTKLTPEQREYANMIQSCSDSLLSIINDILDFSKIEAGKLEFENLDFDLRDTLEETADMLSFKAQEKKLELNLFIHPDVPSQLKGDPGRLRQVLVNLSSNAIKFTSEGEVNIHVSLDSETSTHATIQVKVTDSGIGIPPALMSRLFKSFSQVDASTTRKFGGTGLGLAICKRLTEMMGGQIGVKSEEGKGSIFWFTSEFEKQAVKQLDTLSEPMQVDLSQKRMMVVDDNATNREILNSYLQTWGLNPPALTSDGPEALSKLEQAAEGGIPFDIALLDYMMPKMDGISLCRAIRADSQLAGMKLIMLSSRALRGDAKAARSAGFDAYLTKPIRQSQLYNTILKVLGQPNSQSSNKIQPVLFPVQTIGKKPKKDLQILVVEDNSINQKVIQNLLQKSGYQSCIANNGREALEALQQDRFDLLLMDVQMPEMDGYEATRAIRSADDWYNSVPVIAMTANAMKGDREKCLDAGMNDYLSKPINPEELFNKIQEIA